MTKSRNRKFICVTSLNECREDRCDNVKAYKSSQLTDRYFKPMQTSPVRAIVLITNLLYVSYQETLFKQQYIIQKNCTQSI